MSPAKPGVSNSHGPRESWHPLAQRRFDCGRMTQQQLADKSGINRTTIARIEGGQEPLVATALRLAAVVECKVEDIWKGKN